MSNEVLVQEQLPVVQSANPMTLIQMAVQQGQSVEQLQKLFELQVSWEKNEARKAYFAALNEFKQNPPQISKTKQVSFGGAGKTAYKHATLDNVSGMIGEALSKVNISHHWDTEQLEGGQVRVTCVLTHSLGHSERTPLQASPDTSGSKNAIQAVGSVVTYLQRYTLLAATGMAVGDDDDGKQGKLMPEQVKADWLTAITDCVTTEAANTLWQKIAKACTDTGDIPAYDELKAAMSAKVKALKVNAINKTKEETI